MKAKRAETSNGDVHHDKKVLKRKRKFVREPLAKKKKQDYIENENEDEVENFEERFKFVLAPKKKLNQEMSSDDDEVENDNFRKRKTKNGNRDVALAELFNDEDDGSSSDGSFTDDELESSLDEDEDECSEEWETDTDYSEGDSLYSFHESDCESVTSDDNDYGVDDDYESSSDEDYVPPIEDKYIKSGEAVIYDGKGLDLAFGDSTDSQIVEIDSIDAVVLDKSDEEIPDLIPLEENADEMEENATKSIEEKFKTNNLMIEEDEDEGLQCSQLLKRAFFYDCANNKGVIVKLNSTIHFHGILLICPLYNSVQVNGHIIHSNETIKATSISRTDYFLNLTPIANECHARNNVEKLKEKLNGLLKNSTLIEEIFDTFDRERDVILHLQQGLPDAAVEMINTYSMNPVLPHKNMILKNSACPSSELILATKFFVSNENPRLCAFKLNEDWDRVEIKSDTKVVIIGGKNVGKSGMSQYLINKNLRQFPQILLIDLDIGQPICNAVQTVSATLIEKPLINTGYLNALKPLKCFLYGDKSIMTSPFKYIECTHELLKFCNENLNIRNIPWVINTMGYQKGFGLELICIILRIIQPTDVVQIQHGNVKYNFKVLINENLVSNLQFSFFDKATPTLDTLLSRQIFFTTHVLDSIVNNQEEDTQNNKFWVSNATEKRKMSLLAQLSRLLKNNQSCLNNVTPFCTSINKIRLIVLNEEYCGEHNETNLDLFNGNLVYLCHTSDDMPLYSNSMLLECYGVGIVRAIDKVHGYIYILLPTQYHEEDSSKKLESLVNVLAIGNIPLPGDILLKQHFGVNGKVPYVTFIKDRNMSNKKYINKRNIKDCF
jgi:polynucleotide 5'-hydroxyl-kinase GRC3/NOL9